MVARKLSSAVVIIPLHKGVDFGTILKSGEFKDDGWQKVTDSVNENLLNSTVSDFPMSLKTLSSKTSRRHFVPTTSKHVGSYSVVAYEIVIPFNGDLEIGPLLLIHLQGSSNSGVTSLQKMIPLGKAANSILSELEVNSAFIDMNKRAIALSTSRSKSSSSEVIVFSDLESRKFRTIVTEFSIIFMLQDLATHRLRSLVPVDLNDRKSKLAFIREATLIRTLLWWRQIAANGVQLQLMKEFDARFDQYNQMTELLKLADELREFEKLKLSQTLNQLGLVVSASGLLAAWTAIGVNDPVAGLFGGVVTFISGTIFLILSRRNP